MSDSSAEAVAHLVDPGCVEALEVMGVTVQLLTEPGDDDSSPCILRGSVAPGVVVPLHSHADPETFFALAGELEGLALSGTGFEWARIPPGDVFHIPGGAKHALRNRSQEPAVSIMISTSRIGRFFKEIGIPITPGAQPSGPPTEETIRHFLETADRYGYWNATPEENAAVGLSVPAVP